MKTLTKEELLEKIYAHFPESEDKDETMSLLICDCVETGIGYWCTEYGHASGVSEFYSERVWESVKNGDTVVFGDGTEKGDLNLKSIAKSLDTLKKTSKETYEAIQKEDWDAYSCDEFFQTAVFGEVVFG